jgi:hypothetical protein
MSSQDDYNNYFVEYILYYCNIANSDTTVYQTDLSNVCTPYYDEDNNLQISDWLIEVYGAPSTETLLTYTLSTVLAFFNNFYTIPAAIAADEPYMISTSDLANIRHDSSMIGFVVFDTTAQAMKYLDSELSWNTTASKYLSSNGGTLGGNLNMGSNNITNINNLSQSSPSALSIYTSASSSISFTVSTPQVVSLGSFSQTVNPNSDFSFNSSSGQCTYSGSSTRYFRITVCYSIAALAVASTHTNYLSKNGSTSISGQRVVNTFLLSGQTNTNAYTISDIVQLANNDTIQLGGESSTSSNVTYSNISYSINAL